MKVSQRAESNRASGFISPGDNRMLPYKSPAIKPAAGRGGERSRFSAPASGGDVVNNMNGEKK